MATLLLASTALAWPGYAKAAASDFILRGVLRDQYLAGQDRRYEAPFELQSLEGEFRIRSVEPATTPALAHLYASDYRSSYLSTLLVKDAAPSEALPIATVRYGVLTEKLPVRVGFVVWAWLASRLPSSGEYDRGFLALTPPEFVVARARHQRASLLPEIVRDRTGRVRSVKLWANLADSTPAKLAPSATLYLAAELALDADATGSPWGAALTVYAERGKIFLGRLRTEAVRKLTYRAEVFQADDGRLHERISHLTDRDPPAVFVHDYRFPEASALGYASYRIEAGHSIPLDPSQAPRQR